MRIEEPAHQNNQIEVIISRLYENEGLTDGLTDTAANVLLDWAIAELNKLSGKSLEDEKLDQVAYRLSRVISAVNKFMERRADYNEVEAVEQLIKLAERATRYGQEKPPEDQ